MLLFFISPWHHWWLAVTILALACKVTYPFWILRLLCYVTTCLLHRGRGQRHPIFITKVISTNSLCLFAIKKISQRKILSSQPENIFRSTKNISVKEKFGLVFRKVFSFNYVCFPESSFQEITFQTFWCLFAIRKVGQRKTLSSKKKIWLDFQESVFLKNLSGKHFSEVVKNLEMLLFADYIKFDPQTFNCYIYFLFWIFIFQFHLLKFYFYINFGPYFYNC